MKIPIAWAVRKATTLKSAEKLCLHIDVRKGTTSVVP
jgi:hypothetical protein